MERNGTSPEAFRRLRENAGYTIPEIAAKAGVGRNTIWRIENEPGYRPRESTVRAVAAALKLPPAAFYRERS